jgi:mono/diheme cytochrome c family protein
VFGAPAGWATDSPSVLWAKAKCALCHARDGSGDTDTGRKLNVPDLRSERVQKLTDEELAHYVTGGHEKMPSFHPHLTEQEIRLLVAYTRVLANAKK